MWLLHRCIVRGFYLSWEYLEPHFLSLSPHQNDPFLCYWLPVYPHNRLLFIFWTIWCLFSFTCSWSKTCLPFWSTGKWKYVSIPINLDRTVALCIAAYQEDPDYLRKCLQSVKSTTYPGIKVVMVIDGNRKMTFTWWTSSVKSWAGTSQPLISGRNNYHAKGPGETDESHKESATACHPVGLVQQEYLHHAKMGWKKRSHVHGPSEHWGEVWIMYRWSPHICQEKHATFKIKHLCISPVIWL